MFYATHAKSLSCLLISKVFPQFASRRPRIQSYSHQNIVATSDSLRLQCWTEKTGTVGSKTTKHNINCTTQHVCKKTVPEFKMYRRMSNFLQFYTAGGQNHFVGNQNCFVGNQYYFVGNQYYFVGNQKCFVGSKNFRLGPNFAKLSSKLLIWFGNGIPDKKTPKRIKNIKFDEQFTAQRRCWWQCHALVATMC